MILKVVDLNFLVEQDSKVAKSTRSVIAAISGYREYNPNIGYFSSDKQFLLHSHCISFVYLGLHFDKNYSDSYLVPQKVTSFFLTECK